jgi:hypothetical protein
VLQRGSAPAAPKLSFTVLRKASVRSDGGGMHKVRLSGHPGAPSLGPSRKPPEPRRMDSAATARRAQARKSSRRRRGGEGADGGGSQPPWPAAGAAWGWWSPDAEPAPPWAQLSSAASAGDGSEALRAQLEAASEVHRTGRIAPGSAPIVVPKQSTAGLQLSRGVGDGAGEGAVAQLGRAPQRNSGVVARVIEERRRTQGRLTGPAAYGGADGGMPGAAVSAEGREGQDIVTQGPVRHHVAGIEGQFGAELRAVAISQRDPPAVELVGAEPEPARRPAICELREQYGEPLIESPNVGHQAGDVGSEERAAKHSLVASASERSRLDRSMLPPTTGGGGRLQEAARRGLTLQAGAVVELDPARTAGRPSSEHFQSTESDQCGSECEWPGFARRP